MCHLHLHLRAEKSCQVVISGAVARSPLAEDFVQTGNEVPHNVSISQVTHQAYFNKKREKKNPDSLDLARHSHPSLFFNRALDVLLQQGSADSSVMLEGACVV